jgi:transcriptional regulator with XRE-family HTH domain
MPGVRTAAVGALIRDARTARGWSQADLASRMDVTRQRISAIERDGPVPRLEWLVRAAGVLGIPPADLDPRLAP